MQLNEKAGNADVDFIIQTEHFIVSGMASSNVSIYDIAHRVILLPS